jgi:hypothetical protein
LEVQKTIFKGKFVFLVWYYSNKKIAFKAIFLLVNL